MRGWTLALLLLPLRLLAQMAEGPDTLYGNEWIRFDQSYYKLLVVEDGIYRISRENLAAAGMPVDQIAGDRFQLFRMGKEVPIFVSSGTAPLSTGGYIEFFGEQNRSEMDRYLFQSPDEELLNPQYSLFTDTAAYFLTWTNAAAVQPLRYAESLQDLSGPLPVREPWFWDYARQVFNQRVYKKYVKISGVDIYYSHFQYDGFANALSNEHRLTFSPRNPAPDGPPAHLNLRLITNDNAEGHNILLELNGQALAQDSSFRGVELKAYTFPLAVAALGQTLNVRIKGQNTTNDRSAVAIAELRYARAFDLGNATFYRLELPPAEGERYLEIKGFSAGTGAVLLDPANRLRYRLVPEAGMLRVKLPPASGPRVMYLCGSGAVKQPAKLERSAFQPLLAPDVNYLILSHAALYDDGQGGNPVAAYAGYRSSPAGGSFRTAVVDVRNLYDQYAYGLARHPLAIRNFIFDLLRRGVPLEYVFIIGKGREYPDVRSAAGLSAATGDGVMLVPTFGWPGSDNLLLGRDNSGTPAVPMGRLVATNTGEVNLYLNKVKVLETNETLPQTIAGRAWMKQVLHLGGGGDASERSVIRGSLEGMGKVLETSTFGAGVTGFYKDNTDPIQQTATEQIFDYINQGTSLITFFGHSSPGTFDFNIDNPENYNNYGRYPLMLSLGCYSGNLFTSGRSIGERFVFYRDKGAIAFGASRGLGFVYALNNFARRYYQVLGEETYGQGIGLALMQTLQTFRSNTDIGTVTLSQQFTLQGDPAIRLHPSPGPDYVPDPASVRFEPRVVNAQEVEFGMQIDIVNLGRNEADSITVNIGRQLPSGQQVSQVVQKRVKAPAFRQSLEFRLPTLGKSAIGQNTFFVSLDPQNEVSELPSPGAEQNNELFRSSGERGVPLFVVDNTARPVYPPNLAVASLAPVTLMASTTDAMSPQRRYLMEIDTTARFNSPFKQQQVITQRGGVIKWTPNIPWQDGRAYYWRVSPDSVETGLGYLWEGRSFTYVKGAGPGWQQGHYWQWGEGTTQDMELDSLARSLLFEVNGFYITIKNKIREGDAPAYIYNFDNPAISVRPWDIIKSGVAVVVGDAVTGSAWSNPSGGRYGSVNPGSSLVFSFPTATTEQRKNLINFLTQVIPNGSYVFVFTILQSSNDDFLPEQWRQDSTSLGTHLFKVLEAEGAVLASQLETTGSAPYNFIYRKGYGPMAENLAAGKRDVIQSEVFVPIRRQAGSYSSPLIGPAKSWGSFEWKLDPALREPGDSIAYSLIGYTAPDGPSDTLFRRQINSTVDLAGLDAAKYPYLKVEFNSADNAKRTALSPTFWRVRYQPYPDLAVNPAAYYVFNSDALAEGDMIRLKVALENVSDTPMDSVLVSLLQTDASNQEQRQISRLRPLPAKDTLIFSFSAPTAALNGKFRLALEANPDGDQPELYYFNNLANIPFEIVRDMRNPVLDVTFDGQRILDGDLVSARPAIRIALRDENRFLLLTDPALFDLRLEYPDGSVKKIIVPGPEVRFFPAGQDSANQASLEFSPVFTQSGEYVLQVKARDASGNPAGRLEFQIRFNVVTEKRISHILNYPNPFSTSTHFVYTLTGDEAPANFVIRIMTLGGQIVRELTQQDLGPLRIGAHRTELPWDGTDQYGDKLANGVYLYRVIAKDAEGKDYQLQDNPASGFFEKGFGKLVILR